MKDRFEEKMQAFSIALIDMYRDEDDRKSEAFPKIDVGEDLTEDITAMLYAVWAVYQILSGESDDIIGFTHILNRLAFQQISKDKGVKL